MSFCTYLAEFDCKTQVYVGQRQRGNENIVTVDVGVTFHNPKKLDYRPLPCPCVPSLPKVVGTVNKVRLIWATNLRKAGEWIFTTKDLTDEDAEYLGFLQTLNSRSDYWRFTFRIPAWGVWKSVSADYTLKPPYKQRKAQDNCAYYKEDSDSATNKDFCFGGEGLSTLHDWHPTEAELPTQEYECNFLNVGDVFSFTTPTAISQLLVAPPEGMGYQINYDFLGGYRDNLAEIAFREPGIYAVKVVYQSGESIRFCAVGALGKNSVNTPKQTLTLGLMQKATLPGGHCNLFVSQDQNLAAFGEKLLPNCVVAPDVERIVDEIDKCYKETGKPIQVLLSSHGQPGQIELGGVNVSSFPGGYGYGGTCAATWELDRIIDGCVVGDCPMKGLKGQADQVHFWTGLTAQMMDENACHILKYTAERMVEQGGVLVAQASSWDCVLFAVLPGTTRPGYYSYPKGGNYVTYTSHSTYLPMGTPTREETKEKPNFYA